MKKNIVLPVGFAKHTKGDQHNNKLNDNTEVSDKMNDSNKINRIPRVNDNIKANNIENNDTMNDDLIQNFKTGVEDKDSDASYQLENFHVKR